MSFPGPAAELSQGEAESRLSGFFASHRRGLVLAVSCVSMLMVGIDSTAVIVALPSIGHRFHTGASGLSWIIDAYTLVLSVLLMLSASMADRFGRKLLFRIGLGTFVLGSALCAVAPSLGCLIAFRALQGIGGSMLNPVALAVIANVFTDRVERARAIGVWAGVNGLSFAVGPLIGGGLVTALGWRWIFLVNIPIGLLAIAIVTKVVPESKAPKPRKVDVAGQVLIATFLSTLVFGVIEGPHLGWGSPAIVAVFAVSLLALAGFLVQEPRVREPLLELRFFRSIPFSAACLMAMLTSASVSTFLYLNTIYLQDARGFGPLHAGLLIVPLGIVCVVWGPRTGKIVGRFGARVPLTIAGFAFIAPAVILLTQVSVSTPIAWVAIAYVVQGLGISSAGAPITHTAMSGMPREQAGVAGGISGATRQVGQTIGIAIAGMTLASAATRTPAQLASATHTGWMLDIGYGVALLIIALLGTSAYAKSTALEHFTSAAAPAPAGPHRAVGVPAVDPPTP